MATPPGRRPTGRRPKRLAGHGRPADATPEDEVPDTNAGRPSSLSRRREEDVDAPDTTPGRPSSLSRRREEDVDAPDEQHEQDGQDDQDHRDDRDPADDHQDEPDHPTTRRPLLLVALALLLLAVVVAEAVYVLTEPTSPTTISADRPVVLDPLETQSVVDQAARDVVTIVTGSGATFEEDLERATAVMTEQFAETYRDTKDDVRERWVAERVQVTAQVSAQGVVRADGDQVEALLFLTQATTKGDGGPTLVQYRVVATMVDTDDGWLVSKLRTF